MILPIVNTISFSLGLVLVSCGFFLPGQKAQIYDIYSSTFPMALLIIITAGITLGAIVSDTSFFKSSTSVGGCQILISILLIVMILSLELSAISAGLATSSSVQYRAERSFQRQMVRYARANASAAPSDRREPWIDFTQRTFRCCGLNNFTDWAASKHDPPLSCCRDSTVPLCNKNSGQLHQIGCGAVIRDRMSGEVRIFSCLSLSISLLQLVGLVTMIYRRYISWRPKLPPELLVRLTDAEKK